MKSKDADSVHRLQTIKRQFLYEELNLYRTIYLLGYI